jgi:hypothetical protein
MPVKLFLMVFVLSLGLVAETPIPSLSSEERANVYKMQIAAHRALERVLVAQAQQKQARLEELTAQRDLDQVNADLDRLNTVLSKKYDQDGEFTLTPELEFKRKDAPK